MSPADIAARYREYAAKCLIFAKTQDDPNQRLALVDMARAWIALAEQAEKNQAFPIVYETPSAQ